MKKRFQVLFLTLLLMSVFILSVSASEYDIRLDGKFCIQLAVAKENNAFWDFKGKNLSFERGQHLILWGISKTPGEDRKFEFKSAGNGYYYIYPSHTKGKGRLSNHADKKVTGNPIVCWSETKSPAQKFKVIYRERGFFSILSTNGYALTGKKVENGTQVTIAPYNEKDGKQKWKFFDAKSNKQYIPQKKEAVKLDFFNPYKTASFKYWYQQENRIIDGVARIIGVSRDKIDFSMVINSVDSLTKEQIKKRNNFSIILKDGQYLLYGSSDYVGRVGKEGKSIAFDSKKFNINISLTPFFEPTFFETYGQLPLEYRKAGGISGSISEGSALYKGKTGNIYIVEIDAKLIDRNGNILKIIKDEIQFKYKDGFYYAYKNGLNFGLEGRRRGLSELELSDIQTSGYIRLAKNYQFFEHYKDKTFLYRWSGMISQAKGTAKVKTVNKDSVVLILNYELDSEGKKSTVNKELTIPFVDGKYVMYQGSGFDDAQAGDFETESISFDSGQGIMNFYVMK